MYTKRKSALHSKLLLSVTYLLLTGLVIELRYFFSACINVFKTNDAPAKCEVRSVILFLQDEKYIAVELHRGYFNGQTIA